MNNNIELCEVCEEEKPNVSTHPEHSVCRECDDELYKKNNPGE